MPDAQPSPKPPKPRKIKPPRGTRDLYPAEAARRRWLMERWREVSIRHGFEEVDGPTYEDADLYAVKSGEGILGELFQAFSGKSPEEVERVKETGRAGYALRPEFTPTLARMYAAKANTLPKPCKWFMAGPFFRAERPQRGRLREFLQWNVDVLGLDVPVEKWNATDPGCWAEVAEAKAQMDAECIACCVAFLAVCGLSPTDVRLHFTDRVVVTGLLRLAFVEEAQIGEALALLDRRNKLSSPQFTDEAKALGLRVSVFDNACSQLSAYFSEAIPNPRLGYGHKQFPLTPSMVAELVQDGSRELSLNDLLALDKYAPLVRREERSVTFSLRKCLLLDQALKNTGVSEWCRFDPSIVRGLAYYTGTVFEVIADGERAVAGGGRYDNLIELFGGPPTPAVGFAMGDVVLSLLLQDKGLMPSDDELMGLAGQHPDVFVLSNGTEEAEAKVRLVVAMLRRGLGGRDAHPTGVARGLHVRHSYKATKKVDKLLNEAKKQGARLAVIIQDGESCIVKDLRSGTQWDEPVALDELLAKMIGAL